MGLIYANITLLNSYEETAFKKGHIAESDVKKLNVKALVVIDPLLQQLDVHPDRLYLAQIKCK